MLEASSMKKITILVPCYNEELTVQIFYEKLQSVWKQFDDEYVLELLFINDGSRDGTRILLQNMQEEDTRVAYIDLSRNFGKEIALAAGFDYCHGDAVIIMDADLQDPPELIPDMLRYWEDGYADVYARRRTRKGESWVKKTSAHLYYHILQRMTNIKVQVDTGDFRLLDRQCIEALKAMRECQRNTKGLFSWIGYKKKELLFDRPQRVAGETKWSYWKLCTLAIDGLTSFSTVPLKLSSFIGLIISFCSFLYMIWTITKTLLFGDPVAGYPSLICFILFIGGVQLIVLGIIGEYLGRIFNESKQRPLYLVNEYNGKKVVGVEFPDDAKNK
jgi:polyisoprenyl-phosphate glycosyltransferase